MSKPIVELIKEAHELGINIHDHVAKDRYGEVNMATRRMAKQEAFSVLYGGTSNVAKQQDITSPWTMTEEQIKARCRVPKDFKNEWMGEPFKPCDDRTAAARSQAAFRTCTRQAEDRIHRVGVVPFEVEVLNDIGDSLTYTVHATSALDARCMAFVLDGGCQLGLKHWDDGHVELALAHTEVVG
jgi:hypothetical protein